MVVVWDLSNVRGLFDNVLPVGFPVGFFVVVPWLLWHVLECEGESGKVVRGLVTRVPGPVFPWWSWQSGCMWVCHYLVW